MVTTPTLWGSEVAVSADPNAFGFTAKGLQSNEFTIVWSDTLGDIHGRRFDSLGQFNSTDFLFNLSNGTTHDLRLPELTQQENGTVRVFYSYLAAASDEDIYVNFVDFSTTGGAVAGNTVVDSARDEFKLGAGSTEYNNSPNNAVVYTQLRGTTSIRDLYLAQLLPNGVVIGSPQLIPINAGESVSDGKVIGLPNGTTLVTYTAQKYDAATSTTQNFVRYRIFNEYTDLTGEQNASSTPGNDSFPAAIAIPRSSDGFVITTQDALGIRFLYHAFGNAFTKSVPDTLSGGGGAFPKAISPKITALNDQGFIIAWTDTSATEGDGSPALKIGLHRFDKNGNSVGDTAYIDSPGDQSLNSISTLADGRVIITYDRETGDSTNHFTHNYQIIDPREPTIYGSFQADNIVGREDGSTIYGYEGADTLIGRAAADTLLGGTGADTMKGGAGNDLYAVDNAGDQVIEAAGGGADTVVATVSYSLAAQQEIETLQLASSTGSTALNLSGNEFANTVRGNAGSNVLNGRAGADLMYGGDGNDVYAVDNAGDRIFEAANQGSDTVVATVSYALAAGQSVEALQLASSTGSQALNLTGNEIANTLRGNAGANVLNGGLGSDILYGNAGADTFVFKTTLGSTNVDRIADFVTSATAVHDTIQLSKSIFTALTGTGELQAVAFKDTSTGPIDADDRVLYNKTTGALSYDADGSGAKAAVQFAILDNKAALSFHDFLIVA